MSVKNAPKSASRKRNTKSKNTAANNANAKRKKAAIDAAIAASHCSASRGRALDTTPNKVFGSKFSHKNEDGVSVHIESYNDGKGVRKTREILKPRKQREGGAGRGPDSTPNKVFARITGRNEDGTQSMHFEYNDPSGVRLSGDYILGVSQSGKPKLTAV